MSTESGQVKVAGGDPSWTAPIEGPFAFLVLWAEGNGNFVINGGGGIKLSGVFFTPEGTMDLAGSSDWAVPQNVQFISYQLKIAAAALKLGATPAGPSPAPDARPVDRVTHRRPRRGQPGVASP